LNFQSERYYFGDKLRDFFTIDPVWFQRQYRLSALVSPEIDVIPKMMRMVVTRASFLRISSRASFPSNNPRTAWKQLAPRMRPEAEVLQHPPLVGSGLVAVRS
jgi:hypothetical protein